MRVTSGPPHYPEHGPGYYGVSLEDRAATVSRWCTAPGNEWLGGSAGGIASLHGHARRAPRPSARSPARPRPQRPGTGLGQLRRRPQLARSSTPSSRSSSPACWARRWRCWALIEGVAEATASLTRYPFGACPTTPAATRRSCSSATASAPSASCSSRWRSSGRVALLGRVRRPRRQGHAHGARATRCSPPACAPSSAASPSACTAPWTRMGAVARAADRPGLLSSWGSRCAGCSRVAVVPGAAQRGRDRAGCASGRRGARRRAAFRCACRLARLPLAARRLAGLRRRQLQQHVHPAQGARTSAWASRGVILVYVLYNVIYAAASLPLGGLSDRIGQFPLVIGRLRRLRARLCRVRGRRGVAAVTVLFALYGLYIAATEGTSKALISRATPLSERASAIGLHATPAASPPCSPAPSAASCGRRPVPGRRSPSAPPALSPRPPS